MGIDSFRDGTHKSSKGPGRPSNDHDISERQFQILTGMVASDSSLGKQSYGNPFIITQMANPVYMSWLDKQLGELSTGIEESTSGVSEWSKKSRYTLRTVRHPEFSRFDWVNGEGVKVIPQSVDFTPLVAKVWYAGDGTLMWDSRYDSKTPAFSSSVTHNQQVIKSKLESEGFDVGIVGDNVRISAHDTEQFIDWLGVPVPGYGYKWETDSYEDYLKKKEAAP